MSRNIHVAFGVDEGNLDQVAVVIQSILDHTKNLTGLHFHIIFMGDAGMVASRVADWGYQNIQLISAQHIGGSVKMGLPEASLLRLQLPMLLPDVQRVVYLDADLIVRSDITDLFDANLDGMAIGGVIDMPMYILLRREAVKGHRDLRDYLVSLGQNPEQPGYINSGVLVMDLDKLRGLDFKKLTTSAWDERAEQLKFGDQCLLNIVMLGRIAYLDPRWNVMAITMNPRHFHYAPASILDQLNLQRSGDEWIIHYAGPRKPWADAETWRQEDWWRVADKTNLPFARPLAPRETFYRRARRSWLGFTRRLSEARAQLSGR